MKRTLPGILALLLLAACAAPGSSPAGSPGESPGESLADGSDDPSSLPPEGQIEHPTGDAPVLVMEEVGGFVMVDMLATRLPTFVMTGDGRVIVPGVQTLEFPGPALPPLQERTLTEAGIQEVLAAVVGTGLFDADLELRGASNMVADATDTVFHLTAGGREVTVSVYALGLLDPAMGTPQGMSEAEVEAHRVLSQLRDALLALDTAVSDDAWEPQGWQPYQPVAFRLYVRDVTDQPVDADLPGLVREWPTDEDPATIGEEQATMPGTRCAAVDGEAAAVWLAELSAARQNTTWSDDGERRFSVQARPLLPGEEVACPELVGA